MASCGWSLNRRLCGCSGTDGEQGSIVGVCFDVREPHQVRGHR